MKADQIGPTLVALSALVLALAGCHPPGKPGTETEVVRPEQVLEFNALYKQNCAACHGEEGRNGIAVSLADPVYLALAGKKELLRATAQGGPGPKGGGGALMPAFAKSFGGTLTDQQVEVLVDGIVQQWGDKNALAGVTPPPYAATLPADAAAGQAAFRRYCVRCHGDAAGTATSSTVRPSHLAGPVTDPNFLALISDQSLRSTILAGRPYDGMPDWRGFATQPLTDAEITNIVAWLATQRRVVAGNHLQQSLQPGPEGVKQ